MELQVLKARSTAVILGIIPSQLFFNLNFPVTQG